MEKPMTLQEKIELSKSLHKEYSKKASTLRKRAESLAISAQSYQNDADRFKRQVDGYNSIAFKQGDSVIVSGTNTGEGDQEGKIIEFSGLYMDDRPYYNVQCTNAKKYFVSQLHLSKKHEK